MEIAKARVLTTTLGPGFDGEAVLHLAHAYESNEFYDDAFGLYIKVLKFFKEKQELHDSGAIFCINVTTLRDRSSLATTYYY
jgi:hypothetical protein